MTNLLIDTTCLITGATSGIGLATARTLAARGARLIIVGRDNVKGAAVVEQLQRATFNPNIEWMQADLASQAQIRDLIQRLNASIERLHILINNAGSIFTTFGETEDGIERTWAINYLAPFQLTSGLLPLLQASGTIDDPARIINVASNAYAFTSMHFDDLERRQHYSTFGAYGQSKLALILWTRELARRLAAAPVVAYTLHPGAVRSSLGANNGWLGRLALWLFGTVALTPEQGSRTTVYLATAPDLPPSGAYVVRCAPVRLPAKARDDHAAARLWAISQQMLSKPNGSA